MRITLYNAQHGHEAFRALWPHIKAHLMAGQPMSVEVKEKTRSLEQNARMWAMLTDISRQVEWYGRRPSPEAWKCIFSASLKKQDVVPGLHGDFVVIGQSTSKMTVREMTDLMDLMAAFGAERGVRFTCPNEVAA